MRSSAPLRCRNLPAGWTTAPRWRWDITTTAKRHYAHAAKWLKMAQNDPLLRDYALYWSSQANLALNRNAEALAQLQEFRKDYPDSVDHRSGAAVAGGGGARP